MTGKNILNATTGKEQNSFGPVKVTHKQAKNKTVLDQ